MKKMMYAFGCVEIISGLLLLAIVDLLKSIFPLLGRIAFQAAMAGSYTANNYIFSAPIAIVIAIVLLITGAIQIIVAFKHKKRD